MAEFRAASFRVDITPAPDAIQAGRIWMAGFVVRTGPATAVMHPLSARAIVIEDAQLHRFALLVLDLCGVRQDFTDAVRGRVERGCGLTADQVFVNCTHTHGGPTARNFPVINPPGHTEPDPGYMQQLEDASVAAITNAFNSLTAADLFFSRSATAIGHNRHNPPGGYDQTLDVLHAKNSATGQDIAVVFFHGCHPVSHGPTTALSPDFVGGTRDLIEARLTPGADAIFVQGFAGTIDPLGATELDIPPKLSADVVNSFTGPQIQLKGLLHTQRSVVDLPLAPPVTAAYLAGLVAKPTGPTPIESEAEMRWVKLISGGLANPGTLPTSIATELQTVKIGAGPGAWRMVTTSHEAVNEWSDQVRKIWNEPNVTLAAYTGSVGCYLATSAIVTQSGGNPPPQFDNYEGSSSCMYYGLPSTLDPSVDLVFLDALRVLDPAT